MFKRNYKEKTIQARPIIFAFRTKIYLNRDDFHYLDNLIQFSIIDEYIIWNNSKKILMFTLEDKNFNMPWIIKRFRTWNRFFFQGELIKLRRICNRKFYSRKFWNCKDIRQKCPKLKTSERTAFFISYLIEMCLFL